jgi:hypothetical protein
MTSDLKDESWIFPPEEADSRPDDNNDLIENDYYLEKSTDTEFYYKKIKNVNEILSTDTVYLDWQFQYKIDSQNPINLIDLVEREFVAYDLTLMGTGYNIFEGFFQKKEIARNDTLYPFSGYDITISNHMWSEDKRTNE